MGAMDPICYITGFMYTLLHTKYISCGPHGFREEDFLKIFPIISLWELMTPGAWPVSTTRA